MKKKKPRLATAAPAARRTVRRAARPGTRGLFVETPANPLLQITDLAAMVQIAREHGLLSIADNTFMTTAVTIGANIKTFMIRNGAADDFGTNGDAFMAIFEHEWISWVDPTRSALPADWT